MKRYLIFASYAYYAGGGFSDFYKSFDTLDEAMECVKTEPKLRSLHPDGARPFDRNPFDWYHIIDSIEWRSVAGEGAAYGGMEWTDFNSDWMSK